MAEQIKFTQEEVKQVDDIRNQTGLIFQRIGQLSVESERRLQEIETAKSQLNEELKLLRDTESTLFTSLNTKYGDGNYDPDNNVFTPIEEKKPQEPVS